MWVQSIQKSAKKLYKKTRTTIVLVFLEPRILAIKIFFCSISSAITVVSYFFYYKYTHIKTQYLLAIYKILK